MTPMTDEMSAAVAETDVDMEGSVSNGHSDGLDTYGAEDDAARAMAARELQGIVESLLFISQEPLSIQRLTAVIGDVNKHDVVQALQSLGEELAREGRGIRLAEIAGGFRLVTKQEYASWIKRMDKTKSAAKLSRSALESLAIIAYKQPIVRGEIEEIRGVETSGVVRTLLERKLVRIVGRKEVPGRPIMYGTTKFFLEHFGLNDLSQLPPLREFKELGESEQAMLPMDEAENLTANGTVEVTPVDEAEVESVSAQLEGHSESELGGRAAEAELMETVTETESMVLEPGQEVEVGEVVEGVTDDADLESVPDLSEAELERAIAEVELKETTAVAPETLWEVEVEGATEESEADLISDQAEVLSKAETEFSMGEEDLVEAVAEDDMMVPETVSVVEAEVEVTEVVTDALSETTEMVAEVTETVPEAKVEEIAVEPTLKADTSISDEPGHLYSDDTTEQA
ncbi:MAG: SMC-Scp complex subunit ScpB [Nitrospira sp.]|nr:SMC-Scp complex subunit ScpB [Nitrospira sp.]